ncbi:conserved exported protein of unknown function [Burkholderia multivorans]
MSALRTSFRLRGLLARSLAVAGLCAATNVSHAVPTGAQIDLKVLVLSSSQAGNTPELQATLAILDRLGIPYDPLTYDTNAPALPPLESGTSHAKYSGIIMPISDARFMNPATGNPVAVALARYQFKYNVRLASMYTWPGDTGCLQYVGYRDTTGTSLAQALGATFTATGKTLFPYMNAGTSASNPVPILNAWTYFMSPMSPLPTGTTVTSQIQATGTNNVTYSVAATCLFNNTAPVAGDSTSREIMAISFDNNPFLIHSMTLSYGIVNWVTRGLFVGSRHVYMDPQVDDIGIPDEIFPYAQDQFTGNWYNVTTGAPTANNDCPLGGVSTTTGMTACEYRINGAEFDNVMAWQDNTNANTANAGALKLSFAFNGSGFDVADGGLGNYPPSGTDTLSTEVTANEFEFKWINHTYDHLLLQPTTTPPTTVTSSQVTSELQSNDAVAQSFGFEKYSKSAMVTPEISGLYYAPTLSALQSFGVNVLVSDSSKPTPTIVQSPTCQMTDPNGKPWPLPPANSGKPNCVNASIFEVPRYATALFYNVSQPSEWVAEYNYFYGANGIDPTGWHADQTYGQVIDHVSDTLLTYLLTYDNRPLMFHQSNLRAYSGTSTLLGDLLNAVLTKYNKYYKSLPIVSPYLSGAVNAPAMQQYRLTSAKVLATLNTGTTPSIVLKATVPPSDSLDVVVPVTGVTFGTSTATYGGQKISNISLQKATAYQSVPITPAPAWQ